MNELIFTKNDYEHFRTWLNLNLDGITWQGRFKKEFENFWDVFFEDNLTTSELIARFNYAFSQVKIGSLSSWFLWLRDKFISYIFLYKNKTIGEISRETSMKAPLVATILRNYLLDEYPHLDMYLNEKFQLGNVLSSNMNMNFETIRSELKLEYPNYGSRDDEIMPGMEVTLFDEWGSFIKQMKSDFGSQGFSLQRVAERTNFLKQVKLIQDVSVLLLFFALTIYGVKQGNVWYEKHLANKVSIYEPQFTWLDKSSVFKAVETFVAQDFKLDFDGIKDISKSEDIYEFFDPENYEEESEVTLTSFENIPRDLTQADKEASIFEGDAENPNGYRDQLGGRTKVYRLMMTSPNVYSSRDTLNELVKKYSGEPVGGSRPGLDVPGGVYYNVYIPSKSFKDFMSEAMEVSSAKLFEGSTSNVKSVPGKTRVFIMVKSI